MNFGVKITILYLSFLSLIITLVVLCYQQDVDLVSKDYYAQELKYQDKIDAISNEKSLDSSITHYISAKEIILNVNPTLISNDFSGEIYFFRPSDSSKDVKLKMNFNNNQQIVNTSVLTHGVYKLQLSWSSNGTHYFKEKVVFIN